VIYWFKIWVTGVIPKWDQGVASASSGSGSLQEGIRDAGLDLENVPNCIVENSHAFSLTVNWVLSSPSRT